jgi:hypothetical protein
VQQLIRVLTPQISANFFRVCSHAIGDLRRAFLTLRAQRLTHGAQIACLLADLLSRLR